MVVIRLIIVLVLFLPVNVIFSVCAGTVRIGVEELSTLVYEQEDYSVNADEPTFVEEIQEKEEAVLVASEISDARPDQTFVCLEPWYWEHISTLQINAFFYTNLPPPVRMA
ncbi:hypothetical protein [Maribellus sp. YY47]|uniref:hypothetical protein n=1 Tax=Maribellus sp. YY47 TaxID=2929486 RepID=UPI00200179E4|nr:hypothetical protein [Maribellus sp. YY47]MCK3682763.1 hypothetical protein [Maribellus sp. YY47]